MQVGNFEAVHEKMSFCDSHIILKIKDFSECFYRILRDTKPRVAILMLNEKLKLRNYQKIERFHLTTELLQLKIRTLDAQLSDEKVLYF